MRKESGGFGGGSNSSDIHICPDRSPADVQEGESNASREHGNPYYPLH